MEDDGREWIDMLEDENSRGSENVEEDNDNDMLRGWLVSAMSELTDREQFIVRERQMLDKPRTLESLGDEMGLSKERVRQIEAAAFAKMRKSLSSTSKEVHQFL
jgi:RNA polymerase sigma-32 factor